MKRIWKFVRAVLHHWGILITGGVGIGLVSLWQMTGHKLSPQVGWIIGALAALVACFKAWNEQYERAELYSPNPHDTIELPAAPEELAALDALEKEQKAKSDLSIEAVNVRLSGIASVRNATFTESREDSPAILISFKNMPTTPGEQTKSFHRVTANLTYEGADKTEHIDYGNWLDEYTRYVDFRPGETRDLVIATIPSRLGTVVGLYNGKTRNPLRERFRSGFTLYGPNIRPLPNPPCQVTVTLVSENITLLSERYHLNWTSDGKMEIKKLETASRA